MMNMAKKPTSSRSAKPRASRAILDLSLTDLPADLRWQEWMARIEAVIFASDKPVDRITLARVVGPECNIDLIIDDIQLALQARPYEVVAVAGGWQMRTRPRHRDVIHNAGVAATHMDSSATLSNYESTVLLCVAYFQPVTREELSNIVGKEISRDTIAVLRDAGFLASGPRKPIRGAPYTYVTTSAFLSAFGFDTLQDLPDAEMLEDAGLLRRHQLESDISADD